MGLLGLAIAPGLAICIFIYMKDKYNKEPIGVLLTCFLLGMLTTIPAIIIQLLFTNRLSAYFGTGLLYTALFSYALVAFSEESSKFLAVRYYAYTRRSFDDPFDGIVYAVVASMGFATLENIMYVYNYGTGTGILRMFLSVPAHATFGVLMGYHVGLAKFDSGNRSRHFFLAILLPVIFHGTFDFFLFSGKTIFHFGGAVASFIIAIRLSKKAIRIKQQLSKEYRDRIIGAN